ncbi:rod shape-determining protein MreC [Mucilaginibacter sp. HMF5004]|uniref:rod shape-determining protein MreC n=1 Tax=Mucilaginibacter rivuli TaxID=2857527 RepID=UPI001C5D4A98|nr:rod shape-determining protein MreC [Mucilaginibacter rivuli]MBW4888712.1 rod shape-determining protein MreC [Mucilaginibacter rivuli]
MRNLLIFISKYNAFFLFVIFEIISLVIMVNYNSFQKATYIESSNEITGAAYDKVGQVRGYLSLGTVNDSLARENARLRNLLKSSFYLDTLQKKNIVDSIYKQQYSYIVAKVINNSVNHRNNYITINRGSKDGIAKDMGVICGSGVVGIVVNTTDHLANIRSVLHKDTRISAMLADTKDIGNFLWSDNLDPHSGLLVDVANNVKPRMGEWVVTSNLSSLYPAGIPIGRVSSLQSKEGGIFLNMDIKMAVDYSKLEYVYVINNRMALEQTQVETGRKKDD